MLPDRLLRWVVIEMSDDTDSGRLMVVTAYGPFEDKNTAVKFFGWFNAEHDGSPYHTIVRAMTVPIFAAI
jgi:hypothetical protein